MNKHYITRGGRESKAHFTILIDFNKITAEVSVTKCSAALKALMSGRRWSIL
jgi:hypothetical protein